MESGKGDDLAGGRGKKGRSGGRDELEELWTKTRTTRMLYMEEISEAGTLSKSSFSGCSATKAGEEEMEDCEVISNAGQEVKSSSAREGGNVSSRKSPSLRKRSPVVVKAECESVSSVSYEAGRVSDDESPGKKDDDEDDECEEKCEGQSAAGLGEGVRLSIEKLDASIKKKTSVISSALVATHPLRPFDDLALDNPSGTPSYKTAVANVNKAFVGFKGRVKSLHQTDDLANFTDTLLYDILKPLFLAMKISGLFFVRPKGAALFQNAHRRCCKSISFAQMYSIFIFLILTVNCLRSFWAFSSEDSFGYVLFFKLLWTILWYDSASRSLFFNVMWYAKKTGLPALFLSLQKTCYTDGIVPYEDSLRSTVLKLAVTMTCFGVLALGSFAYGFFGSEQIQGLFDTVLAPVPGDADYVWVYKAFLLLVISLNILVSCLSMTFYVVVCYVLYKEFEYLCRTFGMKISSEGHFTDDLEKFRMTHQQRCKLVEQADQIFKYFVASTFTAHVPLLCLLMYNLLDMEQKMAYRLYGLYWMLVVMVQSVGVAVAATMLNTQAHAPLAYIYGIRAQSSTVERQLVVNMFLNKLTGTSIGLTAWDMFVINKPTMLTVIGMILTYFFLLVQFRNPLQEANTTTACDCTLYNATGHNVTDLYTVSNIL